MLAFAMVANLCIGQDSLQSNLDETAFKASKGHLTTELNINPFKGELTLNNAINQIKVRYFVQNNVALRIGLAYNAHNLKNEVSTLPGSNAYASEETKKTRTLGINFGIEKHFKGTKRLSPYIGGDLSFSDKASSEKNLTPDGEYKVDGAWKSVIYNGNFSQTQVTERGFSKIGANLILGFDYYLAKHLYFGYEIAFGFSSSAIKDIEETDTANPSQNTTDFDSETEFTFGPNLANGIRLGFVF